MSAPLGPGNSEPETPENSAKSTNYCPGTEGDPERVQLQNVLLEGCTKLARSAKRRTALLRKLLPAFNEAQKRFSRHSESHVKLPKGCTWSKFKAWLIDASGLDLSPRQLERELEELNHPGRKAEKNAAVAKRKRRNNELLKLADTHISASEVLRLNEPVNIFDEDAFNKVVEDHDETRSVAARADTIAHATKKVINERLEQDPAFYLKFSNLIQKAIEDFRARRMSELEYLKKVTEIRKSVVCRQYDDVPASLRGNDDATALYGVVKPFIAPHVNDTAQADDTAASVAVELWEIIRRNRKVGFWDDLDAQRRTVDEVDDYLYDEVKDAKGVPLSVEEMDLIIESSMQLARHRLAN